MNLTLRSVSRLTRVIEGSVTTAFCYGGHGVMTQKRQTTTGHLDLTAYSYTPATRLASVQAPDGTLTSYTYSPNGQVSGMQVIPAGISTASPTVVNTITWMPFGPINSYTLGNGQTVVRSYDKNYQLTDLTSPAFSLHVKRDGMGDITGIGDAPGASPATETYDYDPLYRLKTVKDAGITLESYTYDKTGDRLSKTAPGLATGAYLYASGTHRLASVGNAARSSDANGNTTASVVGGESYGFGYNGRNRMDTATRNGNTVASYTYNAFGQRIGKVTTFPQAVNERYAYDEAGHLIGEYGTTNRDYIWLGGMPVAVIDNTINGSVTTSTVNYVTADQLGTPRAVSDGAGTVIWSWAYQGNPFGELQPTSTTGYVLNLRYPGQYYDAETETNYNYFRNFESATGRYLQSDPMGLFSGQMSTYAYVGGNPLGGIDPTGKVGYITQNGNNVTILLPIAFTGGTLADQERIASAITTTWTGHFGQYNVTTMVLDGTNMSIPVNQIQIMPGQRDSIGLSRVCGDSRHGTWFQQPSHGNNIDYAHEAGHLLGLGDAPDSRTLMDPVYTTSAPTAQQISDAIESPYNVIRH